MKEPKPLNSAAEFEKAAARLSGASEERYVLRLYVTGSTPRSSIAIRNLRNICEEHLHGRYDLEVIDLYQQPVLASGEQIIAAPTLIKKRPEPPHRIIGDLSDSVRVLYGLSILTPPPAVP